MDYEKLHKDTITKLQQMVNSGKITVEVARGICADFIPESEDEMISKELIEFLKGSHYKPAKMGRWLAWLEKQGDKVSAIEGFETEFERQVSYLIASAINREHEYNEGYVKWTANALLNFAKHELEEQGEQKPVEYLELKSGHWYICYRAYCCRADHLTIKEGERFMCEKDGVAKGFVIKEPEKYFKEVCVPASIEDEQKPVTDFSDIKTWKYIVDAVWTEKEGIGQYLDSPFTEEVAKKLQKRFGNIEQKPAAWSEEDLQKEIKLQWKNCNPTDEGMGCEFANISVEQFDEIARYFFKLKYKIHNPTEWSGEDEKMIKSIIASINQESIIDGLKKKGVKYTLDSCAQLMDSQINYLKSIKGRVHPQPKQDSTDRYFEGFKKGEQSVIENYGKYGLCKPAEWSKEDERCRKALLHLLEHYSILTSERESCIVWLKSLRPQPKQEWSDEDEATFTVIGSLILDNFSAEDASKTLTWLHSLRPNHWKPSDEQIKALNE